jgi:Sulfotransferase domain
MLAKPLVIGTPRTGFSLLIQVVSGIENLFADAREADPKQELLRKTVQSAGLWLTGVYRDVFARHGITDDLIFNGEFHLLVGGPKWLDKANPERACIRKYFGVRGMGDCLVAMSHPRQVLDYYPVVHSHTAPGLWAGHPHFGRYRLMASIRNPIGVINSACFSLNAMASEHVQKFLPDADETFLRQRLALYKLTDLKFVSGLIRFLTNAYDEFLAARDRFFVMHWEELIREPVATIQKVARALGREVSRDDALRIWKPMDHVNTLEHHRHNYRAGKGIVGDWKNSLVQAHVELFREHGFDRYLAELGYPPVPDLDPDEYSPLQKLIARHIERGEVYSSQGDPDLFGFAFNKSNIDASQFAFKSYPKREWTHVERSSLLRDDVVEAISDAAEAGCGEVNRVLGEVIEAKNSPRAIAKTESGLRMEWQRLAARLGDSEQKARLQRRAA